MAKDDRPGTDQKPADGAIEGQNYQAEKQQEITIDTIMANDNLKESFSSYMRRLLAEHDFDFFQDIRKLANNTTSDKALDNNVMRRFYAKYIVGDEAFLQGKSEMHGPLIIFDPEITAKIKQEHDDVLYNKGHYTHETLQAALKKSTSFMQHDVHNFLNSSEYKNYQKLQNHTAAKKPLIKQPHAAVAAKIKKLWSSIPAFHIKDKENLPPQQAQQPKAPKATVNKSNDGLKPANKNKPKKT